MKAISAATAAFIKTFGFVSLLVFAASPAFSQTGCLTDEEAKRAVTQLDATQKVVLNKVLRRELLDMQEEHQKLEQKIASDWEANQKLVPSFNELGEKNLLRLCEIVKQRGWVTRELVGEDGSAAALFLIKANKAVNLQREIFPVVVAAAEKGHVGKSHVAWLIDSIRVASGAPQIFGTQTYIKNEMLHLYPLQSEAKVDEYRKMYGMTPLSSFIKYLQSQFQMVVLKSPRGAAQPQLKEKSQSAPAATAAATTVAGADGMLNLEEDEAVEKVESNLVNLNVRVSAEAADSINVGLNLQKTDFVVLENDQPQEVEFFSTADEPFDLVLLLDLSGSTAGKQDLIRQSTRRFVEAARPADRIAIVTFTDQMKIVSNLTQNRAQLLGSLKKINDYGGSGVWSAIDFAFSEIIKPQSKGRRSAVVIMTDGVDSSLLPGGVAFSSPTFTDLLETIRNSETTIVPIYLDTETPSESRDRQAYRTARLTLGMIAEESGGQVYYAKKVEDLNGVYDKVITDLGKVYSLGYQSSDENRDGAWRKITVRTPNHPNITARTRPGYYAK